MCILYYCPEDYHFGSEHVARLRYNIHYLITSLFQSTQQDDKHKYLFVDLFTPYGNYTSTKSFRTNFLCLCLDFCGLCLTWGLATLHVKGILLLWHYTGTASC